MIKVNFAMFDRDAVREVSLDEDVFVQSFVSSNLIDFDRDLFDTKWFDYRRMSSVQATWAYLKSYGQISKRIYARDIDRDRAEHIPFASRTKLVADLEKGLSSAKSKLSGYWRGRQVADALGMPYDLYIEHAMTYRMRRWSRAYLPQPQHLYHEFDVEKVQEKWEEIKQTRLILPDDPAYLIQNFQDIPYQNDFHEWLFAQSKFRPNPASFLADLVERDLMSLDKMNLRLTEYERERVDSYLS